MPEPMRLTVRPIGRRDPIACFVACNAVDGRSSSTRRCRTRSSPRGAEAVALREAEAEGAFDAILLNERGRVVETTARNVFLVSGGSLQTPPTYEGALPGITRRAVLEIAARAKIRAREMFVSLDRLCGADECSYRVAGSACWASPRSMDTGLPPQVR